MSDIRIGIVTVSDRASKGLYEDRGGPAIISWLGEAISSHWESLYQIVPDDQHLIEVALTRLIDEEHCCLVLTTGGTGPSERDVTPEATINVADQILPGLGELMRTISLKYVLTASLSRQVGASRKNSLILNLPGNPSAIAQILEGMFGAVPNCIELLGGPKISVTDKIQGDHTSPGPIH
ncbi:MAG: molybdopterin adenylyltransferase [Chloroflexi bacterium]|nr:molybdopterin adenylyltransferase [Chloroflexota bacterium]|tara:strand:+ start:4268 stop:4807 length:540 start_codon:yes stop_codon:yes gene_type:complete